MWITNKLENRQTLKGDSRSSFGRTRGKQGKFPFMGQKTRLRLFPIDNIFLKAPLKSEWNMPFWVAPAGNDGTSENVALFFSIECSKRKFVFNFSKPSSFLSQADLRGIFSVTETDLYKW